jgi:hypothetical protein
VEKRPIALGCIHTCKNTSKVGKKETQLGNHVRQFVFLGLTGYRFPFAHFVSDQIQAYDLHTLFLEAIDQLQVYDGLASVCIHLNISV